MKKILSILLMMLIVCPVFSVQPQLDMTLTLFQDRQDLQIVYGVTSLGVPYPLRVDTNGVAQTEVDAGLTGISTSLQFVGNYAVKHSDGALATIAYAHYKIHKGVSYILSDYDSDVDDGDSVSWYMTTPVSATGYVHLVMELESSLNGTMAFYQNPTVTAFGTSRTGYNSKLSTGITVEFLKDPTYSFNGADRIFIEAIGSDGTNPAKGASTGASQRVHELILSPETGYILIFTSETNNCRVSFDYDYYLED